MLRASLEKSCTYQQMAMGALIILAVFAIAGLFSFVLERVFAQAISYKEDDDLTI